MVYFLGMGHEDTLEYLLLVPYFYQLINQPEQNGWTAAHLAALRNKVGCFTILVGYGADIYIQRDKVGTIFGMSFERNNKLIY